LALGHDVQSAAGTAVMVVAAAGTATYRALIITQVKIYTKAGDGGETSLFDGTRVSKTDPRVAAYGEVDELQAALGVAAAAGLDDNLSEITIVLQRDLFALGARLADPSHRIAARVTKIVISDESVARLEGWIDRLESELPPLRHFILSGGCPSGASLHLARTVCRRAERAVLGLGAGSIEPVLLVYLNRLSDLLFVMARTANHRADVAETEW
jgi:cob(I)alamin adenosyltransferase